MGQCRVRLEAFEPRCSMGQMRMEKVVITPVPFGREREEFPTVVYLEMLRLNSSLPPGESNVRFCPVERSAKVVSSTGMGGSGIIMHPNMKKKTAKRTISSSMCLKLNEPLLVLPRMPEFCREYL